MSLNIEFLKKLVQESYGLDITLNELNGYEELNYIAEDSKQKYIVKVSNEEIETSIIEAQVQILLFLEGTQQAHLFPKTYQTLDNQFIKKFTYNQQQYRLRILSFLEGFFWFEQSNYTKGLFLNLGECLGRLDKSLLAFKHPSLYRKLDWDIQHVLEKKSYLQYIKDHEKRRIAAYFLLQYETEVLPIRHELRHSIVHNDLNDYNILVKDNSITGIIDFGDIVYTQLINNLAIAITYSVLKSTQPLADATVMVGAYHRENTLQEKELKILYYLISARLSLSVCNSAYQTHLASQNEHHFLSEKMAWDLLFKWIEINPLNAENEFRIACGFTGVLSLDYSELEADRAKYIGKNLSISYQKHLKINKAALQYLYGEDGKTYVDCVNNVSHVGHCHPNVVKKAQDQIAKLNTNTRYLNDNMLDYAKALTKKFPSKLNVCYFTNSGSEANDLAIRISRHITKQKDIIVLDHAYHGTSTVAMELSPYKFDGKGGKGKEPYIHKAMNPDTYRGQFRDRFAGINYAKDIDRILAELKANNIGAAAFICETILGVGGQIPLPEGYLKLVYQSMHSTGALCIADEVQVGFGRVGKCFWGFELQEVEPDIVVLGKPIGNGHPLAAVIVSKEIADSFHNGMEYFNTFGGNPVSMATGLAVLETIENEKMQEHALEVGDVLLSGLRDLMKKYPLIGDVRGFGLFVGAELVRDRLTLEPAVQEIDFIVEQMRDRGFLLSTDGPLHNVIKIKPPMVFNKKNARDLVRNLGEIMSTM